MKYTNKQLLNDGFRIKGQVPADDRTVLGAVSELYVSPSNRGDDTLFNRAYVGLKVTIEGDDFASYVCVDAGPYTPGSTEEVKASNWKNYWHKADKDIFDYVTQNVDTSIRDLSTFVRRTVNTSVNLLETYAKTNNIPDANDNGLTITPTMGETGNSYAIKVNTDSSTVAVVNDKLTGGTYRIVRDEDNDLIDSNLFAKYYLVYRKPGSSSDVSVGGSATIEIPKVQILKDAYICKAVEDSTQPGGYRVTSRQGDPSWDTDTNEVFICIEWDIQNGNPEELIGNSDGVTYIGISDIFRNNFQIINASINYLEVSVGDISTKFRAADASIYSGLTEYVDTNISDLSTSVNTKIKDFSTNINARVADVSAYSIDVSAKLNTRVANVSSYAVDVSARLKSNTDTLNARIADVSKYSIDVSSRLKSNTDTLTTRIANVSTYAINVSTYAVNVSTRLNTVNNTLSSNITTVSNYAVDVSSHLSTASTSLTASINEVSTRLSSTSSSLSQSISDLNTTVTNMSGTVGTLDASIQNIFNINASQESIWAAAWDQLFVKNPSLVRPTNY